MLVVGAGGLGCPAALYLAASGVGRLVLADPDRVDLTNLQRQILYSTATIGAVKVEAAARALGALNPDVEVVTLAARLDAATLGPRVAEADVVLDCSDNFATRHAVNRACVAGRKPLVSGAAMRFDAQLLVLDLRRSDCPCYACLFPEDAQFEEVQCSQMGVFAPMAGVVGATQAMEAVKLLALRGERPAARFALLDARGGEWRSVQVRKDPACGVCGSAR